MKIIERKATSSNLKIILAPMAGIKTVTGIFSVRAGWKYETEKNHGVAHFLEHMAFKGTKKRPTTLAIAKEVEGRGGVWNANTSEEVMNYWIKLPCQHMEVVCDILSDMLFNSLLSSEEIEKEKGTIIQELRMGKDMPSRYVGATLWPKLLYGSQPAGREGVGTENSIKAMTRWYFTKFLENLYTDENAVFCLAGKIADIEETFVCINNLFCGIEKGKPKIVKSAVIESQLEPAMLFENRDIEQSHIILGVRAYNVHHSKVVALAVLDTILGGNMSSRMFLEIREKRGLAYYVGTFFDNQSDVGNFGTYAGIAREKLPEAITVIIDEYKKLCDEKVTDDELQRAKDYLIGFSQMYLESSSAVASFLSRQWIMKNKIEPFPKIVKKIQAVTAQDVQEVAQEIFVNKGLNLAIVGPHQDMEEEFLKILKI